MEWELIVFYILLIDSAVAVLIAFWGRRWYIEHFQPLTRYFPMAKGWAIYYFILVLFIGYLVGAYQALL